MSKQTKAPDLLSRTYWNSTIKMSLSKFFILCVLHERSMHGYDVASEVERKTNGGCSPREGTVYPILKQFADGGYVTFKTEIVSGRERKIYTITDKGSQAFKVGLEEWLEITKCLQNCQSMLVSDCC
ncbi:PadR family transcriptional regulator [Kiloniella antarctica]|uniref:PadR family transcriptional regulator n=1 Tax=Kiloniella antarctica TaxID=1550907 RepID=A0ABW5BNW1_9PROT